MSDITATSVWQSVNTLSGIPVGTEIKIQNKGNIKALLVESLSQPDQNSNVGEVITELNSREPSKIIPLGSGEIWVKAYTDNPYETILYVQEI